MFDVTTMTFSMSIIPRSHHACGTAVLGYTSLALRAQPARPLALEVIGEALTAISAKILNAVLVQDLRLHTQRAKLPPR